MSKSGKRNNENKQNSILPLIKKKKHTLIDDMRNCLSEVVPVITQRQVGHIVQPFKGVRADSADLIPGDEQISGVPGDPGRDAPQLSEDAFHGVSRLRALAAQWAGRANGAKQRTKDDALRQIPHVVGGEKSEAQ